MRMAVRCDYIDWEFGQLHARQWGLQHAGSLPIFCLPPSPFSGIAYNSLAPLLAEEHHVIAIDYPGFGGSTAMPNQPSMADCSKAAIGLADALAPNRPLRLLGFHTGTVVAADMALRYPERIDHLLLIDVPFFDAATRQSEFDAKPEVFPITSDLESLEQAWQFNVARRVGVVALPRAFENFVDMISSGEGRNAAFRASFQYDCFEAFPHIACPATCIATAAMLTAETEAAARAIPGSDLISLPEIPTAVLDAGAERLAEVILERLRSQ